MIPRPVSAPVCVRRPPHRGQRAHPVRRHPCSST